MCGKRKFDRLKQVLNTLNRDYETFELGDLELLSGMRLPDARLTYKTYGTLNRNADNAVLMPTFYTGTHLRNEGFFGPGRAIDPGRHFVVSINMFGNGYSTSPTNATSAARGANFPRITLYDNVAAQQRLLAERLGVEQLALVAGWSMAGCQSFQWGAQFPDRVKAIVPFCASAKVSVHNFVFLEGVKAALVADCDFKNGHYSTPPVRGLKAFGRVYAGWAFSQTFFREHLYRSLGFETVEELLVDWERDHVDNWDANNLLAKLHTWQCADISAGPIYDGDFAAALGSISARAIVIPCSDDLYFPPEDNALEVEKMPNAELRVFNSAFGHAVASPGAVPEFARFLDEAIKELLP